MNYLASAAFTIGTKRANKARKKLSSKIKKQLRKSVTSETQINSF